MNDTPDSPTFQPYSLLSDLHQLTQDARENGVKDAEFVQRVRAFLDGFENG